LYNHKFLNSCGTGILPVSFIQIKCTTAYNQQAITFKITKIKYYASGVKILVKSFSFACNFLLLTSFNSFCKSDKQPFISLITAVSVSPFQPTGF